MNTPPRWSEDDLNDQLLYQRAIDGDTLAFQTLVRRYLPGMRAYAIRMLGSSAEADDALQEALIQAWQKLDQLSEASKVKTWLMTITGRKCIDLIRSRKTNLDVSDYQDVPSAEPGPVDTAMVNSDLRELALALKGLPEQQQHIWLMREYGGSSYQEIAEALGITVASVRGKLARARTSLVAHMEEERK